jgi:hypothetical protein
VWLLTQAAEVDPLQVLPHSNSYGSCFSYSVLLQGSWV